ncbi:MAG: FecR domain-containing protein [Nanoarchaeota archaeon]|nr:FecR domain-containing protein [Nanoarchaeota archaeon]
MKKFKYISLAIFIIIILIGGIGYFSITGSATRVAFLNIESGEVMVNTGSGWKPAVDDMDLDLDDKVKTGADSEATIILHESVIINLDSETEVAIANLNKENVKVKQESGSTWNKFTGMAGIGEYSVETPNTVATVRGTGFGINMESVVVGEGEVEVKRGDIVKRIMQGRKAILRDGELFDEEITEEERARIAMRMRKVVKHIKLLREREIEKKRFMVNIAKKTHDFSDEDITRGLEKVDRGEANLDEIEAKAPVKMEAIRKVRRMTEEVIKTNRMIEKVEAGDFTREDLLRIRKRVEEREPEKEDEPVREPAPAPEPIREVDREVIRR